MVHIAQNPAAKLTLSTTPPHWVDHEGCLVVTANSNAGEFCFRFARDSLAWIGRCDAANLDEAMALAVFNQNRPLFRRTAREIWSKGPVARNCRITLNDIDWFD